MKFLPKALLLLAALVVQSHAFQTPKLFAVGSTALASSTQQPQDISYGEESRKYRRTVYTHDDWVRHRSSDRFIRNLTSAVYSGVYKNLAKEVMATTGVATFIVLWNAIFTGYTDFEGVKHGAVLQNSILPLLSLPLTPFTLASPSLGLLLVFRTNTSYQRWDEARKNWGMNINHTRDLVRMANAYVSWESEDKQVVKEDLKRVALATWSFVRAMKRHLSPAGEDEEAFQKELYVRLPPKQAEAIIKAAHRPNRALQDLSFAIEALPAHFIRKNEIHKAATIFEDNLGSSERLLTSPVPLFYTRHTARFLTVWLLLLPFGLWDSFSGTWNHAGMIPATAAISVFLFGIEELATQLEEPFTILPMQVYCDRIYNWCMEIAGWEPNDNNMFGNYDPAEVMVQEPSVAKVEPVVSVSTEPATSVVEAQAVEDEEVNGSVIGSTNGAIEQIDAVSEAETPPKKRLSLRNLFK